MRTLRSTIGLQFLKAARDDADIDHGGLFEVEHTCSFNLNSVPYTVLSFCTDIIFSVQSFNCRGVLSALIDKTG